MASNRITLLFLIIFVGICHCMTAQEQITILTDFYQATNGDNWLRNDNWFVGNPCENEWEGIECDVLEDGREVISTL